MLTRSSLLALAATAKRSKESVEKAGVVFEFTRDILGMSPGSRLALKTQDDLAQFIADPAVTEAELGLILVDLAALMKGLCERISVRRQSPQPQ